MRLPDATVLLIKSAIVIALVVGVVELLGLSR